MTIQDYEILVLKNGAKLYLIRMEMAQGSVADLMKGGKVKPADAAEIAIEVCKALTSMEQHMGGHPVHGDIKPANILFDKDIHGKRVYKLTDFGCAYDTDDTRSAWVGSEKYAISGDFDPTRDVYALGMSLMEIMGAQLPDNYC